MSNTLGAMADRYILALDQGTTSSRAILFDHRGAIAGSAQQEFAQIYPQPGWVEHDASEIWTSQLAVAREVVAQAGVDGAGLDGGAIAGIGITNQRETTVVWDRASGAPVYNAIVWQDRRTAAYCDQLKADGHAALIQARTGLVIDSYFSGTKLKWILDNVPGARQRATRGELCFGTIDSWLLWQLTGGAVHATDVSNASRTMLCNIHKLCWDDELLALLDIPKAVLPQIRSSSEVYGRTSLIAAGPAIPVAGIAGDQQAALFGQMCTAPGMVKNTYGTGCFMLMNTGTSAVPSANNLLTTVAWQVGGVTHYALEGSVFIAGAVVQWLRDELGIIASSDEVEALAASVPDSDGVYVVPAFAGLGAPHWNQHARGMITGLTRGSSAAHIARAALEAIAYQVRDVLKAMEADAGRPIAELRVDGGASVNNTLMQFQADLVDTRVVRPVITETTALGAAYLAGLATAYWSGIAEISAQWQVDRAFEPGIDNAARTSLTRGWQRAVNAAKAWADDPG